MFFVLAAGLTILTIGIVVLPLMRKAQHLESADAYDLTVYKSQLREIDADVDRGLIGQSEAEAAKAEVARRLLNSQAMLDREALDNTQDKAAESAASSNFSINSKIATVAALLVIPFVSAGLYFILGSPEMQSQPLEARLTKPPEQQSLTELVASAERKLYQNPEDLEGWKKLAPIYLKMRRPDKAVEAYANVLRIEGETVPNLANLGEALVFKDAGVVSEQASSLFKRANEIDATIPRPRFYLALELGQKEKFDQAIAAWKSLIADSDPQAPWVEVARSQIASLESRVGKSAPSVTSSNESANEAEVSAGPSREDVEAAAELSPEDRQQMIEGMVERLSERLNSEGGTAEQWVQLIRAEVVLNRPDMAAKTVSKALDSLQSDVDGLEKVEAAARSLGLSITP